MKEFSHHHSFLIKGSKTDAEALYAELLQDKSLEVSFVFEKNLTIETARDIKEIASQTTFRECRYIIISAYSVGHEAQNALLKTLEELPESKKIIFFVESFDGLLPTFVSRFSKKEIQKEMRITRKKNITVSSLLKETDQICKGIKDEVETKSAAANFLDELIVSKKEDLGKVKKLLYFKSCLSKPSASVKQILECAVAISA